MRWAALPLLCVCACSCGRVPNSGESSSDIGPETETDTSTTESTGDDLPPIADLPEQEMCVNASGEPIALSDAVWLVEFDGPQTDVLLGGGSAYSVRKLSESEWRLSVVSLDSGSREQSDHPLPAGNVSAGSLVWTPNDEVLHFQTADPHQLLVQRFKGLNLVDATLLEDDHPRVGWDGGAVSWIMTRAGDDRFTLLGKTRGETEPNGQTREVVWKKSYLYGESANQGTDFQWDERDTLWTSRGGWVGDDAIFSEGGSVVRIGNSGGEIWRVDGSPSTRFRLLYRAEGELVWQHDLPSQLHDDWPTVDAISFLENDSPEAFELRWKDNHCVRRLVSGGLVRGDSELVIVATGILPNQETEVWFHRLSREGVLLETRQLITPAGVSFGGGSVFETVEGDIGVLVPGSIKEDEGFSGIAALFFPFG